MSHEPPTVLPVQATCRLPECLAPVAPGRRKYCTDRHSVEGRRRYLQARDAARIAAYQQVRAGAA